ncbi:hypothetical protein O3P69_013314 [Scylla paramamosain]|uniref:Uncharacterized protein n=1 Tax=Scylla paramamosain TaxID=85552 RepID=A0AAW0U196_SCYPA
MAANCNFQVVGEAPQGVTKGVPGDQTPVAEAGLGQPSRGKSTGEGGGHGRPAHTRGARWSPSPLPITGHTPENVQLKGIDESAINSALPSTPQGYLPLNATIPAPTPHTNTQHNTTPYLDISGGEGRRPQDTMKYRIKHKQSHFAQTAQILTLQWVSDGAKPGASLWCQAHALRSASRAAGVAATQCLARRWTMGTASETRQNRLTIGLVIPIEALYTLDQNPRYLGTSSSRWLSDVEGKLLDQSWDVTLTCTVMRMTVTPLSPASPQGTTRFPELVVYSASSDEEKEVKQ